MAVQQGRYAKITVRTTAGSTTLSEIGNWKISGWSRDMIEHSAFGTQTKKFKPGMIDPGTLTISGFYDAANANIEKLVQAHTSGKPISNSTAYKLRKMRIWGSNTTSAGSTSVRGFWSATGSSGEFYITSMDFGQDKSGLGTMDITFKLSFGQLAFTSAT